MNTLTHTHTRTAATENEQTQHAAQRMIQMTNNFANGYISGMYT